MIGNFKVIVRNGKSHTTNDAAAGTVFACESGKTAIMEQYANTMPLIGDKAPAFEAETTRGTIRFPEDFKGKWVILDFWGSWCRWCVKGFPELKELSAKYGSDLVIVGIDCRDTQERWRAAVEKYGLDWVNVYNDCTEENNPLLDAYGVQGFPTKVIVNPEGKVAKIVVGAEPTFPAILARLMGK